MIDSEFDNGFPPKPLVVVREGIRDPGFTLIELLTVIAVLGVILAIAVPSFSNVMLGSRLSSYANDFLASVHLARSEAIKRNARVSLCVSADGSSCASGNWSQGWVLFHDANNNDAIDTGEAVIERRAALIEGFSMTSTSPSTTVALLRFDPTGAGATVMTMKVCRKTPSIGNQERVIVVTATGRAYVEKVMTATCP